MATVKARRNADCDHGTETSCDHCSWRVLWRMGGRGGRWQSCTFARRQLATAANELCRSRRHALTDEEVYRAVYGIADEEANGTPTLAEWAQTWLARRREAGDVERDYLDRIESVINRRIVPRLGKLRLSDQAITPEVVTGWVAWLRSQPGPAGTLQPPTVREAHTMLHGLLQAAIPRYLSSNPAAAKTAGGRRKSELPKVEPYDAIFLEPGEIELVKAACPPVIRPLVITMLGTGLRLGEVIVLRVEDVTLTGRRKVVRVRRALKRGGRVGSPKSRRSRRDVTISEEVVKVLRPLVKDKSRLALVFTAPEGGRWNPSNLRNRYWSPAIAAARRCEEHPPPLPPKPARGPRRAWRPGEVSTCDCKTRLHEKPRLHDLRHTHVSICVEEGWDATRVSRRVGHESYKTTMDIYGHLWEGGDEKGLVGLDKYLRAADEEA